VGPVRVLREPLVVQWVWGMLRLAVLRQQALDLVLWVPD